MLVKTLALVYRNDIPYVFLYHGYPVTTIATGSRIPPLWQWQRIRRDRFAPNCLFCEKKKREDENLRRLEI